jgi:hypothetical protein
MAASSRYMMVNDIQRETSAVSRPERGGAIMLSDRFTPLEGTKLSMEERSPSGSASSKAPSSIGAQD